MLKVELSGPVLRVTLDRPEVRNAFNDELISALTDVFVNIKTGTRAVVLRGSGSVFCAGGDLNWMRRACQYSYEENVADAMKLSGLFESICACPAIVVAAVHGAAFGGGCGLVAASDVAIAQPGTKFCFSEVKLGLIPATISTFVVPKIGVGHARHLFTTAAVFESPRAYEIGLIHEVSEDLDASIDVVLGQVLANGPEAVAASKKLAQEAPLEPAEAVRRLADARNGAEAKEGVDAFLNKRKPNFMVTL